MPPPRQPRRGVARAMKKAKGKYLDADSDRASAEPLRDSSKSATSFSTRNRLQDENQVENYFEEEKENRHPEEPADTTGPASIGARGAAAGIQEPGTGLVEQSQQIPTKRAKQVSVQVVDQTATAGGSLDEGTAAAPITIVDDVVTESLAQQLFPDSSIGSPSPSTNTHVSQRLPPLGKVAGSRRAQKSKPRKRATQASAPSNSYEPSLLQELNSSVPEEASNTSQRSQRSKEGIEGTARTESQRSQHSQRSQGSKEGSEGTAGKSKGTEGKMSAPAPNQQRHMRACMVCSIVKTIQEFNRSGCPNCEAFLELAGNGDGIQECTSQVFEGLIAVSDTSGKSWVVRHQRLEGYVPGVYATQVEGVLPEDIAIAVENAGIHYIPRDGSSNEAIIDDQ